MQALRMDMCQDGCVCNCQCDMTTQCMTSQCMNMHAQGLAEYWFQW
jgi:hypothetical protein